MVNRFFGTQSYSFSPGIYWLSQSNSCGLDIDSIELYMNLLPIFSLGPDIIACLNQSIELSGPEGIFEYLWSTGGIETSLWVTGPGNYSLQITDTNHCFFLDSIQILPQQNFIQSEFDTTTCEPEIELIPPSGLLSYAWSTGQSTVSITVKESGQYVLSYTDECGSGRIIYNVENRNDQANLFIPNAFSPNDDGLNDSWIIGGSADYAHLTLFDRWGKLVFESNLIPLIWDGKINGQNAQEGVYTFVLNYELCGKKMKERAGTIHLLR